jgi:hypothetical protein
MSIAVCHEIIRLLPLSVCLHDSGEVAQHRCCRCLKSHGAGDPYPGCPDIAATTKVLVMGTVFSGYVVLWALTEKSQLELEGKVSAAGNRIRQ